MPITGCGPTSVVHGVVTFDATAFLAAYPMFASVPQPALAFNFSLATLLLNNSCNSVVEDAAKREQLLLLLTAHITAINNGLNGEAPTGVVGRISQAAQGSVNATIEWAGQVSRSQAYYLQTQWGALYWQATRAFRSMFYMAPAARQYGPPDPRQALFGQELQDPRWRRF